MLSWHKLVCCLNSLSNGMWDDLISLDQHFSLTLYPGSFPPGIINPVSINKITLSVVFSVLIVGARGRDCDLVVSGAFFALLCPVYFFLVPSSLFFPLFLSLPMDEGLVGGRTSTSICCSWSSCCFYHSCGCCCYSSLSGTSWRKVGKRGRNLCPLPHLLLPSMTIGNITSLTWSPHPDTSGAVYLDGVARFLLRHTLDKCFMVSQIQQWSPLLSTMTKICCHMELKVSNGNVHLVCDGWYIVNGFILGGKTP